MDSSLFWQPPPFLQIRILKVCKMTFAYNPGTSTDRACVLAPPMPQASAVFEHRGSVFEHRGSLAMSILLRECISCPLASADISRARQVEIV